ncbi:non-ribosomal peptide synthetase [Marinicrinis sediminis]|uniref:Amino acid adenylation domain-containing protein n=1 Tax=Marinicrinis sediminis TaxID=1652465 RepID=A0ABW5R9F4_9BACL
MFTQDAVIYPISPQQRGFWLMHKMEDDFTAYNTPSKLILDIPMSREMLNRAMNAIVERHPALRTIFVEHEGIPSQVILPYEERELVEEVDLSSFPDPMAEMQERIERENKREFDLSKPMIDVKLYRLSDQRYGFYFNTHHMVTDGWGIQILMRDVRQAYQSLMMQSTPQFKPLSMSYMDWIRQTNDWLESDKRKEDEAFWLDHLQKPLPTLDLPVDKMSGEGQGKKRNGHYYRFQMAPQQSAQLNALARANRVSPSILMISVYVLFLHKLTGDEDIIVGMPISGRDHKDYEELIGLFTNNLCLRTRFEGVDTFADLLNKVKKTCLDAYRHGKYPMELLVSELNVDRNQRNPIFTAAFQLFDVLDQENANAFDFSLWCRQERDRIQCRIDYCTDWFNKETIERFSRYFLRIVEQVAANVQMKLNEVELIPEAEKQQILQQFNRAPVPYARQQTIDQCLAEQAARTPDQVALICEDKQLTYRQLEMQANQLAFRLRELGIKPKMTVGIFCERSIDMVVAMLGILKAGGTYVPLDPLYPEERLAYMLADTGAAVLITQTHMRDRISFGGPKLVLDEDHQLAQTEPFPCQHTSNDPAYILYTSGSTGRPKGIMIEHHSVMSFMQGVNEDIPIRPEHTVVCLNSIAFDVIVLEVLLPLSMGARVVIANEHAQVDGNLLKQILHNHQVDVIQVTPARLKLLMSKGLEMTEELKLILLGGEPLPPSMLDKLREQSNAQIINMYGPTETTVWTTTKDVTNGEITVGKPISNTQVYVVNDDDHLQPIGLPGEVCIGGTGLARGYVNLEALTDEKYVPNPFRPGEKMYRTGDLAKWLPNGELAFIGRKDFQVKINGLRIELGEIEATLDEVEGVRESVVMEKTPEPEEQVLVAYYTGDEAISTERLRDHLSAKLPFFMVPQVYVHLLTFPITQNGKINRAALPEPDFSRAISENEYVPPQTEAEKLLVRIWEQVLEREPIGIHDNYFDVGGNSFAAVKIEVELEKEQIELGQSDIFKYQTIRKLAEQIERTDKARIHSRGNQDV